MGYIDINDSPLKWETKTEKKESDELNNKEAGKNCKIVRNKFKKFLICLDRLGNVTKKKL